MSLPETSPSYDEVAAAVAKAKRDLIEAESAQLPDIARDITVRLYPMMVDDLTYLAALSDVFGTAFKDLVREHRVRRQTGTSTSEEEGGK